MTTDFSTCDILDANPQLACLQAGYISYGGMKSFAGPVRTVRCREDNSRLRQVVGTPGEGAVLVVDGAGSLEVALVGDRLARTAADSGWVGMIIEGAVRDSTALARIKLGIKALGVIPRRSHKSGSSEIDVAVSVGGLVIGPGDFVWSDPDGVVVRSR